ncbi:gas vesicle protein GvpH [Halococcus sp. AFM35]|uniref:gas vesicle protein GvpH n=1 Tax=Halococcus sp. AFM35 TaxID=3421653 RepID=UPI003EB877B2
MTDNSDNDGKSGFVRTVLSDLFETITEMDERDQRRRTGTGSARSGTSRVDYGLSIGIGPQADVERETSPAADTDHAASVSPTEDGCVVTIDLPDVDPRELAAGVDGRTLLIADDEGVIERVSLPHEGLAVDDASFNNGILDVRLHGRTR